MFLLQSVIYYYQITEVTHFSHFSLGFASFSSKSFVSSAPSPTPPLTPSPPPTRPLLHSLTAYRFTHRVTREPRNTITSGSNSRTTCSGGMLNRTKPICLHVDSAPKPNEAENYILFAIHSYSHYIIYIVQDPHRDRYMHCVQEPPQR